MRGREIHAHSSNWPLAIKRANQPSVHAVSDAKRVAVAFVNPAKIGNRFGVSVARDVVLRRCHALSLTQRWVCGKVFLGGVFKVAHYLIFPYYIFTFRWPVWRIRKINVIFLAHWIGYFTGRADIGTLVSFQRPMVRSSASAR